MENSDQNTVGAGSLDPESWVDEYGDYLYNYALLRVREGDIARDLIQETFLAAVRAKDDFARNSSIRTWLTAILKRKIIDYFRTSRREIPMSELEKSDAFSESLFRDTGKWIACWKIDRGPVKWGIAPADALEQEEFWRTLEDCLGKLPDTLSRAFVLREIEELSTDEICNVLDVTPTNLWVLLHRARVRLRQCIEDNWIRDKGSKPV